MLKKLRRFTALLCIALCAFLPLASLAETAKPKNYLLLGQDYYTEASESSSRTDTIVMVSLDTARNRLIFTSILRDSQVTTPKGAENKLNTVFSNYSYDGIKETLKKHLNVDIDGVVVINFQTIKDLIDAFGGVDIEITKNEYGMIHSILLGQDPNMPDGPGMTHMSGRIALAYMRDRYSGSGDFTRTEHQRKVLAQLLLKASSMTLPQMLDIYNTIRGNVKTDMSAIQLLSVLQTAYPLINAEIINHHVPQDRTFQYSSLRGSSVLVVDWKKNTKILDELLNPPEQ